MTQKTVCSGVVYLYFDDKRGGGNNFHPFNEMAEPDGTYTLHQQLHKCKLWFRADKNFADVRAYYNDEDYVTISESLKGTQFNVIDVDLRKERIWALCRRPPCPSRTA